MYSRIDHLLRMYSIINILVLIISSENIHEASPQNVFSRESFLQNVLTHPLRMHSLVNQLVDGKIDCDFLTFVQKRPLTSVQKRPLTSLQRGQKGYRALFDDVGPCVYVFSKEPYIHATEPCSLSKEPCMLAKEPYIHATEPYIRAKEPYNLVKEPCILAKEPCILSKEPCVYVFSKRLCLLQRALYFRRQEYKDLFFFL